MEIILLIIPLICCAGCIMLLSGVFVFYPGLLTGNLFGVTPTKAPLKGRLPAKGGTKKPKPSKTPKPAAAVAAPTGIGYEIPEGIKTDCPPNKRGVIGWEHYDRNGLSYMWCNSDPKMGYLHDKLSYLSVPTGMTATVFENVGNSGLVKKFDAGEWDLHQHTFENGHKLADRASSLTIEGTPVDAISPATTQYIDMNR